MHNIHEIPKEAIVILFYVQAKKIIGRRRF